MFPASVRVASMSWPTMSDGWVLADSRDGNRVVLTTTNAGVSWTAAGEDANGAQQVLFSDSRNGWIVGVKGVRATHDGGASWATVGIPGGIETGAAVAAAAGTVHVAYIGGAGTGISIASSPIDRDAFVVAPVSVASGAGPRLDVSMSAGGPYGELIYNDRTFVGAAQIDHGQWTKWDLNCPYANPAVAAGLSPGGEALAIGCSPSGFGDDAPVVGANLSTPTLAWVTVAPAGQAAQGQALIYFATATDQGVRVIVYTRADGTSEIASSTDGGATWPTRTTFAAGAAPTAFTHLPNGSLLLATDPRRRPGQPRWPHLVAGRFHADVMRRAVRQPPRSPGSSRRGRHRIGWVRASDV